MSEEPSLAVLSEARRRELDKLRRDLGPLVLDALDDDRTVEVLLNEDGRLWQERLGQPLREIGRMDPHQAEALICGVAHALKTTVTRDNPLLEGELPLNGERFAAQMPPVTSAPTFTIRKPASQLFMLDDYVAANIMRFDQAVAIRFAISTHLNIVISGPTGSGKSTLVNAVIADIVRQYPHERLVILEDTIELQCAAKNVLRLRSNDKVSMTRLLRATLRNRPDRIIVGEVRGPEALDLLDAWNTGHPGGVLTVHANSAEAALTRLETLVTRHPQHPRPIAPLIGEAVDLIIHIEKTLSGRVIKSILEVDGYKPESGYQWKQV